MTYAYPGLDLTLKGSRYDPEIARVEIDNDKELIEALGGEFDDDLEEMLRVSLLSRLVHTDDRRAPEWLVAWLDARGYLARALEHHTDYDEAMNEEEFRWLTNPSMMR